MPNELPERYHHTQSGALYLITVAVAIVVFAMAGTAWKEPTLVIGLLILAGIFVLLSLMFKHLTVSDEGEYLAVRFGPLPVFRRRIPYADISSVQADRTSWIDGWGIHWVPGRGYTYNLWGFSCVKLEVRGRVIRIGSDDVENLVKFIKAKIAERG